MSDDAADRLTLDLRAAAEGDRAAGERLVVALYGQLRAAAQRRMAMERASHTLSATALVHEVYLRLSGPRDVPWRDRAHYYAAAAEAMRRVLVDHARGKNRAKRGGEQGQVSIDDVASVAAVGGAGGAGNAESAGGAESARGPVGPEVVALDAAIRRLEERDPRMGEVVRLKFYCGLEVGEVAAVLGVSERTVKSDWAFAKAWLMREMGAAEGGAGGESAAG